MKKKGLKELQEELMRFNREEDKSSKINETDDENFESLKWRDEEESADINKERKLSEKHNNLEKDVDGLPIECDLVKINVRRLDFGEIYGMKIQNLPEHK